MSNRTTVAVVGSAPFAKQYGGLIDECDVVIRFNAYRTKKFEKTVGAKTTIWCSREYSGNHRKLYGRRIPLCKTLWIAKWKDGNKERLHTEAKRADLQVYFIPKSVFTITRAAVDGYDPSTGMIAIHAALRLFSIPLLTFGFNHFCREEAHHYYHRHMRAHVNHNREAEAKHFQELKEAKLIIDH